MSPPRPVSSLWKRWLPLMALLLIILAISFDYVGRYIEDEYSHSTICVVGEQPIESAAAFVDSNRFANWDSESMAKIATVFESWVNGNNHCGAAIHSDKPFAIRVPGSVRGGSLFGIFTRHYRSSHLLIMIIYVDGTRAAKVIDLPPAGTPLPAEIVVRMP